jgi:hypothetical protein
VTADRFLQTVAWSLLAGVVSSVILGALKSSEEQDKEPGSLADDQEDS